jgi:hypothetical protein
VRSTGTRYGWGGTYLCLEEHTTAWRNTLRSGGTQCGLQEHDTAWEEHN